MCDFTNKTMYKDKENCQSRKRTWETQRHLALQFKTSGLPNVRNTILSFVSHRLHCIWGQTEQTNRPETISV